MPYPVNRFKIAQPEAFNKRRNKLLGLFYLIQVPAFTIDLAPGFLPPFLKFLIFLIEGTAKK